MLTISILVNDPLSPCPEENSVKDNNDMPGHLARRFQQIAVAVFLAEVGDAGFDLTPVQYAAVQNRWYREACITDNFVLLTLCVGFLRFGTKIETKIEIERGCMIGQLEDLLDRLEALRTRALAELEPIHSSADLDEWDTILCLRNVHR